MEKTIEIDINNKYDLIDKYNNQKVSDEIIEYIIKQERLMSSNTKSKIIINNRCGVDKDISTLLKKGLKEEYSRSLEQHHKNNMKQVVFLIFGVLFIFLSTLIDEGIIWKEVLLISGWVPIWEMIEVELFSDSAGRRKRMRIKKLLNSEILVRNIEKEKV